jgi:hypothetical protein
MNKILRLILLAVLVAVGFWVWTILFPDPQKVIRKRLNKVAQLASFSPNEGNLTRAFDVKKLGAMFSDDAQIHVDVPEFEPHVFTRDEMTQALMAAKRLGDGLHAEFVGINVELGSGGDSALANLTLKAKINGQNDLIVQEFNFTLKKIKGDWLITRVETVNTLKP